MSRRAISNCNLSSTSKAEISLRRQTETHGQNSVFSIELFKTNFLPAMFDVFVNLNSSFAMMCQLIRIIHISTRLEFQIVQYSNTVNFHDESFFVIQS